jgi:glycosyltransferase involved in cell wall biosynthesis
MKEGFSAGSAGAIALVVRDITRATAMDWDTTVIGRAPGGRPFDGRPFLAVDPSRFATLLLGANGAYGRAVRQALDTLRPALTEVHNRPSLALSLARALAPAPVSLVLHNDPQGMRAATTPQARTHLLRQVSAVVCVSDWVRRRLTEGVADAALTAKVSVIHNGLDLDAAPPPRAKRDPLILFVGRITADKGFDSFVRACGIALPLLPGWRAEAIGSHRFRADSPETSFIRSVRPEAEAAGVRMLGFQENDVTLAAMRRAAVVVMPSRWDEPFGRVAQEAQMAGAALVASRRGGLPEAAGEAALYADPESPAEIAAAIQRLATDDALAARLRAEGARHVRRFGSAETRAAWSAVRRGLVA